MRAPAQPLHSRQVPAAAAHLPSSHLLLALIVVAVWGSNFVVIRIGLASFPPLLFATLRFCFTVFPAVIFFRRPDVPWRGLVGYGLLVGAGQFGLVTVAMDGLISPGIASLVMQTQVIFTIGLSIGLRGERIRPDQLIAIGLATAGITLIAGHTGGSTSLLGIALTLCAAACWAGGNVIAARSGGHKMLAYIVWSGLFAIPPLLLMSLLLEGPAEIAASLHHAGLAAWATVFWQSSANALLGYAAWTWLLARHPAASIVPVALLIPVFGMVSSTVWLGESMPGWKLAAAALVIAGLALNLMRWDWIGTKRLAAALQHSTEL